jgi:hypothetical protein
MTESELFIELLHRLRHYDDAVVLYAALAQGADKAELQVSAAHLALHHLQGQISRKKVQRSLARLSDLGLVEVRTYDCYRSHIRLDSDALRSFLRVPISQKLPGLADQQIRFLEDWNEQARLEANDAIKNMKRRPPSK